MKGIVVQLVFYICMQLRNLIITMLQLWTALLCPLWVCVLSNGYIKTTVALSQRIDLASHEFWWLDVYRGDQLVSGNLCPCKWLCMGCTGDLSCCKYVLWLWDCNLSFQNQFCYVKSLLCFPLNSLSWGSLRYDIVICKVWWTFSCIYYIIPQIWVRGLHFTSKRDG